MFKEPDEDKLTFLADYGVKEPGLNKLIKEAYDLYDYYYENYYSTQKDVVNEIVK